MSSHDASSSQRRLVVFSPLPPLENGIAHYTASLLPGLSRLYRCTVVIDDGAPWPVSLPKGVDVLRVSAYVAHRASFASARHLFHVGNNADHLYMIEPLNSFGGIVVLHDPSLHYLLDLKCYHSWADLRLFRKTLWKDHGLHGLAIADQAIRLGWATDATHTDLPALGLVLERASGIIVHSEFARGRAQARNPDLAVAIIPHFAGSVGRDRTARRMLSRSKLNLPPDAPILLALGFINRAKQIPLVLDALNIVRRSHPDVMCVIIGRDTLDGMPLHEEIARRGLQDSVTCLGHAPEAAIADYLDACDILLNLRYPTQGETSGAVSRALGRGVCTFVNNHGWFAELPDDAVIKIPALPDHGDVVAGAILYILSNPDICRRIEQAALSYAETHMALPAIVQQYEEAIEAVFERSRTPVAVSGPLRLDLAARPSRDVISKVVRSFPRDCFDAASSEFCGTMWWIEGLFPDAPSGTPTTCYGPPGLWSIAAALFGFEDVGERPHASQFSRGLCVGRLEDFLGAERRSLAAFLVRFAADGICIFDFWHAMAQSCAAERGRDLLAELGFELLHCVDRTELAADVLLQRDEQAPEICFVARCVGVGPGEL